MKIFVASDLHGSYRYGKQLLDKFVKQDGCMLILLGDIYYHGPRNSIDSGYDPMALSTILNGIKDKLTVIKGNCDSEVDEMISDFKFLPTSTLAFGDIRLTLSHGHHYDIYNFPADIGDVFLYGHTHQGFIDNRDGIIVANPGSVTLPKGGTPRSYIVIENRKISLKQLDDDTVIAEKTID